MTSPLHDLPASATAARSAASHRPGSDVPFYLVMGLLGGSYVALLALLVVADIWSTSPRRLLETWTTPEIVASIRLTLLTCTITAMLSMWVAVPLGYLLARVPFRGRWLVETLLDIPVVLPPLVIGLSLLILFHLPLGGTNLEAWLQARFGLRVTYAPPAVVLAQFTVACAFAVQTLRVTFERIDPRAEQVAWTLGCRRSQAFWWVVLPQAWRGLLIAFTVAWARALGEFGPIYVFAGTIRGRTEVMSTSVFLELSVGELDRAVAVALLMVAAAAVILGIVRGLGARVGR